MKLVLCALVLLTPLLFAQAADWNLARVPAPDDPADLAGTGFVLFHRAGDYWIGSLPEGKAVPAGGMILSGYDIRAGELFRLLLARPGEADKLTDRVVLLYKDEDEAIFQATQAQLESLPPIQGQFVRLTTTPKPMGYHGGGMPPTDEFHPMVPQFVNQVSQTQYTQYVQTLQDFVTRNTRHANCDSAAAWILSQFQAFGLNASYDLFQLGTLTKRNVIGELPGLVYPDSLIFITAHYDATAGSPSIPEAVAPGADDNASGTACVLECARILSQYDFQKTIRFVAFAGEEQGLYGSEDYVANLQAAQAHVVGSFNFDMIAWSGNDPLPPDLVIYSDNNPRSQAMAAKIEEAILTFLPTALEPDIDISPGMTGSDHSPFWDAGWPAICGIEEQAWGPDFNPYYHTVNDVVANCDLVYAANCTRAAIAALSDWALPISATGPFLTVYSKVIDDLTGNQNGQPDPGETISLLVTLINAGSQGATGISGTLTTTDPHLSVTQSYSTYPNLASLATGAGVQAYILDVSPSCPQGATVNTTLNLTAAGGYQNSVPISFIVGDPLYDPMGPDAYGYYAFDVLDQNGPVYNWMEIDPMSGGAGALINYTSDDQTVQLNLPFAFRYYAQDYTQISVCTNGWIAMGSTTETDYSNSAIPNSDGPPAMIAPFWEDLSPHLMGRVSHHYDSTQHCFVVEFLGVRQYTPPSATESFEVILYDPAHHPTPTGDGKILFQYKRISDPASCTVGIEDPTESMGLQYLYNANYNVHAAPLDSGMAILFVTAAGYPEVVVDLTPLGTPIVIPVTGGTFNYTIGATNNETTTQNFQAWCDVSLPGGGTYGPTLGPVNASLPPGGSLTRTRVQTVPASAPAGSYTYHAYAGQYPNVVWSTDSFPFAKNVNGGGLMYEHWLNYEPNKVMGEAGQGLALPLEFSLSEAFPNPFNPVTALGFQLPASSRVSLRIYDTAGREVATLVNGWRDAGVHEVTFDASDLASGLYFCRMQADGFTAVRKLMLVK